MGKRRSFLPRPMDDDAPPVEAVLPLVATNGGPQFVGRGINLDEMVQRQAGAAGQGENAPIS